MKTMSRRLVKSCAPITVCVLFFHGLNVLGAGKVVAWGSSQFGLTNACATDVVAIATGYQQTLLLKKDGTVANCGMYFDPQGHYVNGMFSEDFPITVPANLSNVIAVAGGYAHSVALKADGTITNWGLNTHGQLDAPASLTNVIAISASDYHSLALRADGSVAAWGIADRIMPDGLTNIVAIAAGSDNLVLRADGSVTGWGYSKDLVQKLAGLSNIVAISSGWSAGWNEWMALSDDGVVHGSAPEGLSNIVAIAASSGTDHHVNLAIRNDSTVIGWGYNFFAMFGVPMVPAGLTNAIAISSDSSHSLALVEDGMESMKARSTDAVFDGQQFSLSVPTRSGKVYRLEYTHSMEEPSWSALPLVAGNGRNLRLTDTNSTHSQRFYRVRQW